MTVDLGMGTVDVEVFGQHVQAARWRDADGHDIWITPQQLRVLAHALHHGRREGAYRMGIGEHTFGWHLRRLYQRLAVDDKWAAAVALGWVRVPDGVMEEYA